MMHAGIVRLQWDPDHLPNGSKHPGRRALQLGLRDVASFQHGDDINAIQDVSAFAHEQGKLATHHEGMIGCSPRSALVILCCCLSESLTGQRGRKGHQHHSSSLRTIMSCHEQPIHATAAFQEPRPSLGPR